MDQMFVYGIAAIVVGALGMLAGNSARKRVQLIEGTPIAPAASVLPGRNAVLGTVEAFGPSETTPMTNRKCVWYSYRVEESHQRRDKDGSMDTEWRTVEAKTWGMPFLVRDESGAVLVDPTGATVLLSEKNRVNDDPDRGMSLMGSAGMIKRTENALLIGDPAYVLGYAGENSRLTNADPALRVAALELRASGTDPFIISDKQPQTLAGSSRFWAQLGIYGGGALAVIGLILTMIAPLL